MPLTTKTQTGAGFTDMPPALGAHAQKGPCAWDSALRGHHTEILTDFTFEFVVCRWSLTESCACSGGLEPRVTHDASSLPPTFSGKALGSPAPPSTLLAPSHRHALLPAGTWVWVPGGSGSEVPQNPGMAVLTPCGQHHAVCGGWPARARAHREMPIAHL